MKQPTKKLLKNPSKEGANVRKQVGDRNMREKNHGKEKDNKAQENSYKTIMTRLR